MAPREEVLGQKCSGGENKLGSIVSKPLSKSLED